MDLLFGHPKYFWKVYFCFSLWQYALTFFVVLALELLIKKIIKTKPDFKDFIKSSLLAVFVSVIICMCLFRNDYINATQPLLNPLFELKKIFSNDVHYIRGTISNIILYVPFGILLPVWFERKDRIVERTVVCGFIVSLMIEICQYIFKVGCLETADIICNVIGAFSGSLVVAGLKFVWVKVVKERN